MRLCFLGPPPSIHLQRWVRHFIEGGHEAHLVSYEPVVPDIPGLHVHRLADAQPSLSGSLASPARDARTRRWWSGWLPAGCSTLRMGLRWLSHGLRRTIREIHPDILHGHFVSEHGFYAALAGFSPLVVSAWGSDIMIHPWASPVNRLLVAYTLRRSALIHSVSPVLSAKIHEFGVSPARIVTLPCGVDEGLLDLHAAPRSSPGPVLLNTKMLHDVYNFPILIRAVGLLRARYPTLILKLAGDGPLRKDLERLVERLGVRQQVEFLGVVSRTQLMEHLSSADVFVSPSFSEGASVSLLEAMAVGVVPVVSDIPANREWIVHGQNGFLAPPTDALALAQAIEAALTQPEEWKRNTVSRNKQIIRSRALWKDQMRLVEAAYQRLCRDRA